MQMPVSLKNRKMPLPFNRSLDLELIALVKDTPMLYNPKHPRYGDHDHREVCWQRIGDTLKRPAPVCKQRWINMRDQLRRRLKDRILNPKAYIVKYKYETELSFMAPLIKDLIESAEGITEYLEDETDCEVEMPSEVFVSDPFDGDSKDIFTRDNIRLNETTGTIQSNFLDLNTADPLDVFLMTIGTTLRKFSPYYLNQAKSKIFQVVQDYELQQISKEDRPGNSDSNT